jgi:hypothetical protein
MPHARFLFRHPCRIALRAGPKGAELPNLDAAEREAMKTVIGLVRDVLPKVEARKVKLSVCNDQGERVLTIRVAIDIERSAQAAGPSREMSPRNSQMGIDGTGQGTKGSVSIVARASARHPRGGR